MVNASIIQRLLNNIEGYVQQLRDADDIDYRKFTTDIRSQRFVERTLQIAVEAVLDTAHHIISDEGYREPENYADALAVLAEHQVISLETAATGRLMAKFRNKVVHYYEKIDPQQVYIIFRDHLGDFDSFTSDIRRWLNTLSAEP